MIILITTMNFLSTHCTACLRQINAYILYSGSYRLLRGLHLLVSPLSVLGLVSCVSIVLFCADNSYNTAPQAGTGRKACMNAHLQQTHTHTHTHYKWSCPHLQAYSISPLSAIIIHLKPPHLFIPHTSLHPSFHNLASCRKREGPNCYSLWVSSTKSSVARVQCQWRRNCPKK